MSERPERLSDEQVAWFLADHPDTMGRSVFNQALAREVQDMRLLLNGGPCPTCGGRGLVQGMNHRPGDLMFACPNPDRRHGHRPGVIERLERMLDAIDPSGFLNLRAGQTLLDDNGFVVWRAEDSELLIKAFSSVFDAHDDLAVVIADLRREAGGE